MKEAVLPDVHSSGMEIYRRGRWRRSRDSPYVGVGGGASWQVKEKGIASA